MKLYKLISILFFFLITRLFANTATWTGSNGNWSEASNWGGRLPSEGDIIIIPQGSVTVDISSTPFSGLYLNGGILNMNGNDFSCNILNSKSSSTGAITNPSSFNTIYLGVSPGGSTFYGSIGDSLSMINIAKYGTDTWSFGGSYSCGTMIINNGEISLLKDYALKENVGLCVYHGKVTFNDHSQKVTKIAGGGTVELGRGLLELENFTQNNNFAGEITGIGGRVSFNNSNSAYSFTLGSSTGGSISNTYTGLTTVKAGIMVLHKDPGITAIAGNVLIDGGTLRLDESDQISSISQVEINNGTFDLNDKKQEIGYLNGSGGDLNLGSGLLTISQGGNDQVFAGKILGSGSIIKRGTNQLLLTGKNNFSNIIIAEGTLRGPSFSLPQKILNNKNLIFDQNVDGTFLGEISGSGSFVKDGNALLSYNGTEFVQNSATILRGEFNLQSPISVNSLTISSPAKVSGHATVNANIECFGTLSPGNSIGTLKINGDLTFKNGSKYLVDFSPTESDLVDVSGNVNINDQAIIELRPTFGTESYINRKYLIINSDQGVNGQFANVYCEYPAFKGSLSYDVSTQVQYLTLDMIDFVDLLEPNSESSNMAAYLNTLTNDDSSDLSYVVQNLQFLHIDEINDAFDRMHPSIFKGFIVSQESNSIRIASLESDRARLLYNSCCTRELNCKLNNLWIMPYGDFAHQDGLKKLKGYDSQSEGFLTGYDRMIRKNLFFGLATGYSYSDIDWCNKIGKGSTNSFYGGLYSFWFNNHFYVNGAIYGVYMDSKGQRSHNFFHIDRVAKSHQKGAEFVGHIDGGIMFGMCKDRFEIRPNIALDYIYSYEDSFSEKGAQSLNLHVKSKNHQLIRAELGLNLAKCFPCGHIKVIPELGINGVCEVRIDGKYYKARFLDQSNYFKVNGSWKELYLLAPSFFLNFTRNGNSIFSFGYRGEFGQYRNESTFNLEMLFRF